MISPRRVPFSLRFSRQIPVPDHPAGRLYSAFQRAVTQRSRNCRERLSPLIHGSRLEQFTIAVGRQYTSIFPSTLLQVPLWLKKTAGKDTVSIGDFLPYELDVTNSTPTAQNVFITDTLPLGFRYRKGSTQDQRHDRPGSGHILRRPHPQIFSG